MKTYDAIEIISKKIIEDNLCEALILKGSIGRGRDDEYSDADLYAIVSNDNIEKFNDKKRSYLSAYLPIIFSQDIHFAGHQTVAVFENGLHFDLYTTTYENLSKCEPIKVIYDPEHLFEQYIPSPKNLDPTKLSEEFHNILFAILEADAAYHRKNYAWMLRLLSHSANGTAIVLRSLYDQETTELGLKHINKVLPEIQYQWLLDLYNHLNAEQYRFALNRMFEILDFCIPRLSSAYTDLFQLNYYLWTKEQCKTSLLV